MLLCIYVYIEHTYLIYYIEFYRSKFKNYTNEILQIIQIIHTYN